MSYQRKLQHLYLRAGFGESISVIKQSESKSIQSIVGELFENSNSYTELSAPVKFDFFREKTSNQNPKDLTKAERIMQLKNSSPPVRDLNIYLFKKMYKDKAQLREKMTLFWHGHFACIPDVGLFAQKQNNTIRKHSLGKFGDLLMEISKDTAMLQFLNNQQNRKASPNENFSRELMELFTLGRSHYSESDVREAARAFTGWGFDEEGDFVFRENQHDFDEKVFFNKSGKFTGEDIISMILEKRRTSDFITEKIYKYFVNINPDEEIINVLSKNFYESEYDIGGLMRNIFTSDWFYEKENIGSKIKSPVEFIACIIRNLNIDFEIENNLLVLQRALSQVLLSPPSVAGWTEGKNWIDPSSLLYRLKFPGIIFKSANLDYKEDANDTPQSMAMKKGKNNNQLGVSADLKPYLTELSKYDKKDIFRELSEYFLQVDLTKETLSVIKKYTYDTNTEKYIHSLILRLISTPEYQFC